MDEAFHTTCWSEVLAAGQDDAVARAALATLLERYWFPLYGFARRRGASPEAAEDGVQAFYAFLLEKGRLDAADRDRGRFRSFLLTAFANFLGQQHEKARAQKRGGGRRQLSLDRGDAEARLAREPATDATPKRAFLRSWALTLLGDVLDELEASYVDRGEGDLFAALRPALTGEPPDYAALAASLDRNAGALRVALHRMRGRYRELLVARVADTLDDGVDPRAELTELLGAVC